MCYMSSFIYLWLSIKFYIGQPLFYAEKKKKKKTERRRRRRKETSGAKLNNIKLLKMY